MTFKIFAGPTLKIGNVRILFRCVVKFNFHREKDCKSVKTWNFSAFLKTDKIWEERKKFKRPEKSPRGGLVRWWFKMFLCLSSKCFSVWTQTLKIWKSLLSLSLFLWQTLSVILMIQTVSYSVYLSLNRERLTNTQTRRQLRLSLNWILIIHVTPTPISLSLMRRTELLITHCRVWNLNLALRHQTEWWLW